MMGMLPTASNCNIPLSPSSPYLLFKRGEWLDGPRVAIRSVMKNLRGPQRFGWLVVRITRMKKTADDADRRG